MRKIRKRGKSYSASAAARASLVTRSTKGEKEREEEERERERRKKEEERDESRGSVRSTSATRPKRDGQATRAWHAIRRTGIRRIGKTVRQDCFRVCKWVEGTGAPDLTGRTQRLGQKPTVHRPYTLLD
ncbi:hypothetical protein KM043_002132 [Ampulex compressa]|nr:hypothetical protein KM043_002132 [Ampulex compressa]